MFLPRHSIIISDQFTEPLLNVQCECHAERCSHTNNLVLFEIEKDPLLELLQK